MTLIKQTELLTPLSADVYIITAFQDADPMGVIYHGNYFRFFEEARRILMEKIDYSYQAMKESGYLWPVVDVRVKYIKPIRFNHKIKVTATLSEWEHRLRVDYCIEDAQTGVRLSKGYTIQVAVEVDTQEMHFVSPKIFTDKVHHWYQYGEQAQ